MDCYYRITNKIGYRPELHAAFMESYPMLDVSEQVIAEQRRAIVVKNFIYEQRLKELKRVRTILNI